MLTRTMAAALVLLSVAVSAGAQQFGRNKVQYERFEFRVLETPHFDVYYYDEEARAATLAARLAEQWYDRLAATLHHQLSRRTPIVLYASHSHFAQTSVLPGMVPEGVGGFTDHRAGRVVLPFGASLADTDHVLGHELVHAFQRDIMRREGQSLAMLPLWFAEGMAEQLSVGTLDPHTRMWLRDSLANDRLPSIAQLGNPSWFPYRYGQALWAFLEARYGDDVARRALDVRGNAVRRLERVTGTPADELTRQWHAFVRDAVGTATRPGRDGLVAAGNARYTLGPALSPDGKTLVYLSERGGYSMDLFATDLATGTTRRLFNTATDPHVDSVQFIDSSGAWDPSGRFFVLATVSGGAPLLTIFDVAAGRPHDAIAVPDVDQIFTPSWSPDGTRIAFSALKGGATDIYTIGVADHRLTRLTDDAYADLQPAWSPDGARVAFATDRFSTSLEPPAAGPAELAVIDSGSGEITYVGGLNGGKNINPQWSADGARLYFVSDADGVSNVYAIELASRDVSRVTSEAIGVSGIAPLSPAISIGAHGSRLLATIYDNGAYRLRSIDLAPASERPVLAQRPAVRRIPSAVAAAATSFLSKAYRPRLSLFTLGQPYLSAGGGPFGSFMRAGVSLTLGDLLGQQEVQAAVQVGKGTSDFAFDAAYINRASRWNWGFEATHIPWTVGTATVMRDGGTGDAPRLLRDAVAEEQRHQQLTAMAIYPMSRSRRIELSAGIDAVTFTRRVTTTIFDADTGDRIGDASSAERSQPAATSLVVGTSFVHDTSVFGATGPVMGARYRAGLVSSIGALNVATAVADYRRYFVPMRPLTFAVRAQEVARAGRDTRDPRMLPLVWMPRELVRGFNADAVTNAATRVSSLNAELRAPLSRLLGTSTSRVPVDLFGYSDWARFDGAASRQLWSVGAGARLNAAGFVFEFNAVRPSLPASTWRFEMNFRPGF